MMLEITVAFPMFRHTDKTRAALSKTTKNWANRLRFVIGRENNLSEDVWSELEETLISADIGVKTSLELIDRLRSRVRLDQARDLNSILSLLKQEIQTILEPDNKDQLRWYDDVNSDVKPFVLMVVGVNGVGKTTSIAKIASRFVDSGKQVLIGAGDTFRPAAIEQLRVWGDRLGVDVVAHQQGSDPGAVAFDCYQAAVSRGVDVLIFDTAGRLHTKAPLMEELSKIRRVFERQDPTAPHQTLLVLDAVTGQNGIAQAKVFSEMVGIDGIFLAKLDGTAKGGIVVAITKELNLPVVFVGTGENASDLSLFDHEIFVDALFSGEQIAT
jgi:fused signal recognition particle receptor